MPWHRPRRTLEATKPPERAGGRPSTAPPCVALTGGIGSGKSSALAAFARCGAAVLSADEVVHGLMGEAEVVDAIVSRFGAGVLDADGAVDRAALGPRAFQEEGGIAFLEDLIHPRVEARRTAWVARQDAATPPAPLLVCEVPLLFEVGIDDRFDAALVVTASESVRRERVEARGQRFAERQALQVPEDEKVARADRAYVNEGSLSELQRWVAECFAHYAGRPCDH